MALILAFVQGWWRFFLIWISSFFFFYLGAVFCDALFWRTFRATLSVSASVTSQKFWNFKQKVQKANQPKCCIVSRNFVTFSSSYGGIWRTVGYREQVDCFEWNIENGGILWPKFKLLTFSKFKQVNLNWLRFNYCSVDNREKTLQKSMIHASSAKTGKRANNSTESCQ